MCAMPFSPVRCGEKIRAEAGWRIDLETSSCLGSSMLLVFAFGGRCLESARDNPVSTEIAGTKTYLLSKKQI